MYEKCGRVTKIARGKICPKDDTYVLMYVHMRARGRERERATDWIVTWVLTDGDPYPSCLPTYLLDLPKPALLRCQAISYVHPRLHRDRGWGGYIHY
jgi:hypothetical protein